MAKSGKNARETERLSVRRSIDKHGFTPTELFDEANPLPVNPCENESVGFLICNGTDQEVISFPGGGPWVVTVTNGIITFTQPPAGMGAEQAPAPRESNGPQEVM